MIGRTMEEVREFEFAVVAQHADYLEFSINYKLEYNLWSAEGIGWLSQNALNYYLRSLSLNRWPAVIRYIKTAGIQLNQNSMKFEFPELERLTLLQLQHHLVKSSPNGKSIS